MNKEHKKNLGEYTTHINERKELKCWYNPTVEYSINKKSYIHAKLNKSISLVMTCLC